MSNNFSPVMAPIPRRSYTNPYLDVAIQQMWRERERQKQQQDNVALESMRLQNQQAISAAANEAAMERAQLGYKSDMERTKVYADKIIQAQKDLDDRRVAEQKKRDDEMLKAEVANLRARGITQKPDEAIEDYVDRGRAELAEREIVFDQNLASQIIQREDEAQRTLESANNLMAEWSVKSAASARTAAERAASTQFNKKEMEALQSGVAFDAVLRTISVEDPERYKGIVSTYDRNLRTATEETKVPPELQGRVRGLQQQHQDAVKQVNEMRDLFRSRPNALQQYVKTRSDRATLLKPSTLRSPSINVDFGGEMGDGSMLQPAAPVMPPPSPIPPIPQAAIPQASRVSSTWNTPASAPPRFGVLSRLTDLPLEQQLVTPAPSSTPVRIGSGGLRAWGGMFVNPNIPQDAVPAQRLIPAEIQPDYMLRGPSMADTYSLPQFPPPPVIEDRYYFPPPELTIR